MVNAYAVQLNETHNAPILQQYGNIALPSTIGHLLARHIATIISGIPPDQYVLEYTPHGKPYIKENPHFHFNLAHSGKWVVCATDAQSVGIDIEQITPIDTDLYRTYLSQSEYVALRSLPPALQLHHFYDLWTLKESYLKQTGTGLSVVPSSFSILDSGSGYTVMTPDGKRLEPVFFNQYDSLNGYKMATCATNQLFATLQIIKLTDITV